MQFNLKYSLILLNLNNIQDLGLRLIPKEEFHILHTGEYTLAAGQGQLLMELQKT